MWHAHPHGCMEQRRRRGEMSTRVKGPGYWLRVMERYAAVRGAVTMREFAEQEGIPYWTFIDWLYGVRKVAQQVGPSRGRQSVDAQAVRMLPVHVDGRDVAADRHGVLVDREVVVRERTAVACIVEAELPGGVRLRFAEGTAPEYLGVLAGSLVRGVRC